MRYFSFKYLNKSSVLKNQARPGREVFIFNKSKKLIYHFKTISQAEKKLGYKKGQIKRFAEDKKLRYGFYISFENEVKLNNSTTNP